MVTDVLVAESAPDNRTAICLFLKRFGYRVGEAADGPATLRKATLGRYDLVLVDFDLPGLDGEKVVSRLRCECDLPVIALTRRSDGGDRVQVLDSGADDCLVKPFSLLELEARIRAVLRRSRPMARNDRIEHPDLLIDRKSRQIRICGVVVDLTAKEFDLLAFLAGSPDRAFTREDLLEYVWGSTQGWQSPTTVTEHMRRLRRKIERDPSSPRWLHTVNGVGYRFGDSGPVQRYCDQRVGQD